MPAGCATPGETRPLRIGSVGNYSGPAGSSLISIPRAVQAWAQWVNQRGGVCGRRVQVIVVDDHSDPAQHRTALRNLVENHGVIAFSNGSTLTGEAGVEYLKSVKVPEIGGLSTGSLWDSPMSFKTSARPTAMVYGAARNVVQFGPGSNKVALVTCREVDGCGGEVRREMIDNKAGEQAGVEIVYSTEVSIAQPDYTAECRGAQAAGAASVLLFLDAASVRRFGQSCARQGFNPVYSQVTATVTAETKDQVGLSNLLVALPSFPFSANATELEREFQQAMAQFYEGPPGPGAATGWSAAKMFELAASRAAATGSITAATVVDVLHTMRNETLGGLIAPVTFSPGKAGVYAPCWFPVKAADGVWITLNDGKPVCRP